MKTTEILLIYAPFLILCIIGLWWALRPKIKCELCGAPTKKKDIGEPDPEYYCKKCDYAY